MSADDFLHRPWLLIPWVGLAFASFGCGSASERGPTEPTAAMCQTPVYVAPPAGPRPCPSASDIAAIRQAVQVEFVDDPTRGTLVCRLADGSADLTRLEERAFQALLLMRQVTFDAPLPWTHDSLWSWFVTEVRGIRFRGRSSFCCEGSRVIVLGVSSSYDDGFPSMIEGLVHEARHADQRHPHTCGAAADQSIAELGAYGVQYYLNVWLAEHSDDTLTPAERRYSANRAEWMRAFSFCQECR